MPEFEFIKYEKSDHIAYITINRPDVMNAMNPPSTVEMHQAWEDFNSDPDSWVAIVTGAGERAFSAGMDLRWRNQANAEGAPARPPVEFPNSGFGGLTNPRNVAIW